MIFILANTMIFYQQQNILRLDQQHSQGVLLWHDLMFSTSSDARTARHSCRAGRGAYTVLYVCALTSPPPPPSFHPFLLSSCAVHGFLREEDTLTSPSSHPPYRCGRCRVRCARARTTTPWLCGARVTSAIPATRFTPRSCHRPPPRRASTRARTKRQSW
ncbi:hypothetical protein T492DRAFT_518580 [Pavlovales sp. CCMP2436]|nr:hypothetical protein T492DRAFT_518580 [Pavlovales sp. CCMP2436]